MYRFFIQVLVHKIQISRYSYPVAVTSHPILKAHVTGNRGIWRIAMCDHGKDREDHPPGFADRNSWYDWLVMDRKVGDTDWDIIPAFSAIGVPQCGRN